MKKCIVVLVYLLGWLALLTAGCGDESQEGQCRSNVDCESRYSELGSCQYVRCDIPTASCRVENHQDYHQCEDGHPCTQDDYCLAGECLAGSDPDCDDGIDCTKDACDEGTGCSHAADNSLCDDQNDCTNDVCDVLHGCTHVVDQNALGCQVCSLDQDCDDQDPCTEDYCDLDLLLCQAAQMPDGSPCDDGDPCTDPDTCQDGQCLPGTDVCSVEVCDNQEDDDGDELVDCEDDDCLSDPACQPCDDDGMEDNDTIQAAAPVSPGNFFRLAACPEDPDYYGLELCDGDTLEVSVDFAHTEGDLDLRILDAAGELLAESAGVEDGESLQLVAETSGMHFIEVVLAEDLGESLGNDYDMSVVVEESPPTCPDDGFENNDSFSTAVPVAEGEFADLRACPGDQDHYAFSAAAGDVINLAVMFSNLEGDIDLQLLDPQGQVVATASTTSDNETLAYTAALAGSHVARVWLDTDAGSLPGNTYVLHVVVEQGSISCNDDGFEDNDGPNQAVGLSGGTFEGLRSCPGDEDFFSVFLGVGDQITVSVQFEHAEGDIDLQLFQPGGGVAASSATANDDESLSYVAGQAGGHQVRVWLGADTGSVEGNDYSVTITIEQAQPTCPDDGFENNDDFATASGIGPGDFSSLRACEGDDDFFAVILGVDHVIAVDLVFAHDEGDVDLQLLDPAGTVVASSLSVSDDEALGYTARIAGVYRIRAWLQEDSGSQPGNDYQMSVSVEEPVPTCDEDGFEDNDSAESAMGISQGAFAGLRSCSGDEDFYAIDLGVEDQITVTVTFVDAEGDIDLQLINPDDSVAVSSTSSSDNESVEYTAGTAGAYLIRTWLHADDGTVMGNDYDMVIDVQEAVPVCPEDDLEENDTFATAAGLSEGDHPGLRVCSGDEDFYSLVLGVDDEITVDLAFLDAEGDIDLQLLDPGGTVVASSSSSSDNESLVHSVATAGDYRIRVWLYADSGSQPGNDYDMSIVVDEAVPLCAEDSYEDNDSLLGATLLGEGSYSDLRSCNGDEDYYAVALGVDDEIQVSLLFADDQGDIDLHLLDPMGLVVASSSTSSDNEDLSYTAPAAGTYTVRVWLYLDAGAGLGNDYEMVITIDEAVVTCPDDGFEDNDSFFTAAVIMPDAYPGLRACSDDEDYYLTTLFAGEQVTVDLAFTHAEGDIDLQLLDALGDVVASSMTTSDNESLSYTADLMGFYTIRVVLFEDEGISVGNDYDLNLQIQ